ncbi:MAG: DNA integrity scanning protein DisA nucleotide-binding domain protein [Actinobacteria bacterium]|nr:DNA integrity scanning protein DisA nucleotide-binding domain protein [Actinomycetota bacterium]
MRLTFSERADTHIPDDIGVGTRHASARRFSFDEPDTVVFVVSEDGPLTVYSSGEPIARLDNLCSDAQPPAQPEHPGPGQGGL